VSLKPLTTTEKQRYNRLLREHAQREMETLRIWRPLPQHVEFFMSPAKYRILRGGNRSGKSSAAFVEVASAAMGIPVVGPDDQPMPMKFPTDRPLTIWIVGWDEAHIGGTVHRMLFTNKAFRMIRDQETQKWRCWRPWEADDKARESEVKFCPPLIPPSAVAGWVWKKVGAHVFEQCNLKNGTIIRAFSSYSEPPQGEPVDLVLIDEDIQNEEFIDEMKRRIMDYKGRFIWAALPHSKNNALIEMSERAEAQRDREQPDIVEWVLRTQDNPYIDENEKRIAREMSTEDEQRMRDSGEFLTDNVLVYPSFNIDIHGCPRKDEKLNDRIDEALIANALEPPEDWMRLLILDPGHVVCAILFGAVPPPRYGRAIVVYDELYLRRLHPDDVAKQVEQKVKGHCFETFIIDNRAGRQTQINTKTIRLQYSEAFHARGIRCIQSDSSFLYGSDNVLAGIDLVRDALSIRSDGKATLRIVREKTPWLQWEMRRYKKRIVAKTACDEPVQKDNHLCDCLRYLVSHNPEYVPPDHQAASYSPAYASYLKYMKEEKKRNGSAILLGPAS
jgi:hypothetical protein